MTGRRWVPKCETAGPGAAPAFDAAREAFEAFSRAFVDGAREVSLLRGEIARADGEASGLRRELAAADARYSALADAAWDLLNGSVAGLVGPGLARSRDLRRLRGVLERHAGAPLDGGAE